MTFLRVFRPILGRFVLFMATLAVLDSTCGGERVNGSYLRRRLPMVAAASLVLGAYDYWRGRKA